MQNEIFKKKERQNIILTGMKVFNLCICIYILYIYIFHLQYLQ